MNPIYYAIRRTVEKSDILVLHKLYDYVYTLENKHLMNLSSLYIESEKYAQQQVTASDKAKTEELVIEQYKSYQDILGEWGLKF